MTNRIGSSKGWINCILFLILAFLWSGSFINIKVVVGELPPVFCAFMRVLISLLCLGTFFLVMRKKVFHLPTHCWHLWLAGLFTQGIPFLLLFFGEKFIAPALASVINSTVSIWALLLGTLIFRDLTQWTPIRVGGLFLGLIGMLLIFFPFLYGSENSLMGISAVMGMAIAYAIGGLINQHLIFKRGRISFEINLIQQHVASILFLLIASWQLESWPSVNNLVTTKTVLSFLYLGVMATAVAWIIYFHLIREWGAVRAASVMYLVPVLAILWDLLFLHLIPAHNELIGIAFILSGVILIQWVKKPTLGKISCVRQT